jgi:hypothetical protein
LSGLDAGKTGEAVKPAQAKAKHTQKSPQNLPCGKPVGLKASPA